TLLCQQCRSIAYCSKECQKSDWSCHKLVCSQFKEVPARPGESWKLAIFFAEDSPSPKLIWAECKTMYDPDDIPSTWYMPNIDQYICPKTKPESSPEYNVVGRNLVRNRDLEYQLVVVARDTFLFDGSQINQGVKKATKGMMGHTWCGPITAMHTTNKRYDSVTTYGDVTLRDFRDVVDYFAS
ncbi:hypothetical protein BDN72DRAFT_839476, partial [Pluteus cervinus]